MNSSLLSSLSKMYPDYSLPARVLDAVATASRAEQSPEQTMMSARLAEALTFVEKFYQDIEGRTGSRSFPRLGSSTIVALPHYLTLADLPWHSADEDYSSCSLAQTLETSAEWLGRGETLEAWKQYVARYLLSPAACAGILRRAKKRDRSLPPMLEQALAEMAAKNQPKTKSAQT